MNLIQKMAALVGRDVRGFSMLSSQKFIPLTPMEPSPMTPPSKRYLERQFNHHCAMWGEHVCEMLRESPTMMGLVALKPALQLVPIRLIEDRNVWQENAGHNMSVYDPKSNSIYACSKILAQGALDDEMINLAKVLAISNGLYQAYLFKKPDSIVHRSSRGIYGVLYGHAAIALRNVFSLTVAYDLAAKPDILGNGYTDIDRKMSLFPEDVMARSYALAIREDKYSHASGAAANRAFRAYFSNANRNNLADSENGTDPRLSTTNRDAFYADRIAWYDFVKAVGDDASLPVMDKVGVSSVRNRFLNPFPIGQRSVLQGILPETIAGHEFKPQPRP